MSTFINTNNKTGIIYCRVSSSEQVENTSLESQEKYCREYAQREGIEIIEEPFVERGESAKTANRTEFQKAIARCSDKKSPVNFFIVYKVDRFARNQDDHVTVRAVLKRYGTELRSVTEPINETPYGRLFEGVISSFAEFDNNVRTERSRNGMIERVRSGFWCWAAPVGYYRPNKGSNIVPHSEDAMYIKLIFEEWVKNIHTYKSLAGLVSERGMKTRYDKKPTPSLIEKILKNKIYMGVIDAFGEINQGTFEPLVSKELFYQCQKDGASSKRLRLNPNFPLAKFTSCSECGKKFTGSFSRGKLGKKYPYYHHQTMGCKVSRSIPKDVIEQEFTELLDAITPSKKYEKLFRSIVLDIWQSKCKKMDERNIVLRKQIDILEKERQQVFILHRQGKYSDDEFLEQKSLISNSLKEKYQFIESNQVEEFSMEETLEFCFKYVRNLSQNWKNSSASQKMKLQGLIFSNNLQHDGQKFRTPTLSPIYETKKTSRVEKSLLAAPRGIEPLFPG